MSTSVVQVGLVALFALMCCVLAAAWSRGRLAAAAVALFVVACLIWIGSFAAIASGYHDADGFVDCRDECSTVHYLSALGFLAPPLLISLSALGMIVVVGQRRRIRRRAIKENHA